MSVEVLGPEQVILPDDREMAQVIGLAPADHEALTHTEMYSLGDISLPGEEPYPVARILCGPDGTTKQGGTKFKAYPTLEAWGRDTIDHGVAMRDKLGGIDEVQFGGGKTVANIDPNPKGLSTEAKHTRLVEALDQVAGLTIEAGLADPQINGTAGDEGTNGEMGRAYLHGLRRRGVPHPEACVTGKLDMHVRPGATGRGAAITQRTAMRHRGEASAGVVVQGAGFAGAYYVAEAYDPLDEADRDVTIIPMALGDIRFRRLPDGNVARVPATLVTDNPNGLPITREMVNAVLLDPTDHDMQATGHDKLAALARKVERTGTWVTIKDMDALAYDAGPHANMYLAPAATSNVIRSDNIGSITIKNWLEIGNHTVSEDLLAHLGGLGVQLIPGELANAGGVKISTDEKRRDLARIAAAEAGTKHIEIPDNTYEAGLRATMMSATQRALRVAEAYGVELPQALKMVSLANYAVSRTMGIDGTMRALLAQA